MAAPAETVAPPARAGSPRAGAFQVHLDNFDGPFDLLLSLITARELDVTEVALAEVTDDFVAHLREAEAAASEAEARGEEHASWDLGTASEFLVVAATLLDLKAARLLPGLVEEDAEDLELLEARDLLFARLLQYRAYKEISGVLSQRLATEGRRVPRAVPLESHLAAMLPELVWTLDGDRLAELASRALEPKPPPVVGLTHLHAPAVSVREQAGIVAQHLRRERVATFRALTAGEERLVVVARFLALLELFRAGQVAFDQVTALGELSVRWTGGAQDAVVDVEEFEGVGEDAG
ncbi:segregation/condensation protein A [Isoptericola chiayiensis]|uniref:segregation/condensation protein A n=1 Tax=Isoptericola chiayiensis TaxID=579446 RepID=UPI001553D246|nr:segregation and condensation protein A [Isoptericola chiayiensis]